MRGFATGVGSKADIGAPPPPPSDGALRGPLAPGAYPPPQTTHLSLVMGLLRHSRLGVGLLQRLGLLVPTLL